ncbi:MAG: hypothetical protein ACQXXG_08810 [Candidatus Bathyarchaeia archaeon]|jgi:uncharacterized protein YoaH (UPF0181 family)|nr:hypothetical protein [Candidatus Bathyarchaeota archaeon A05DMB-3]
MEMKVEKVFYMLEKKPKKGEKEMKKEVFLYDEMDRAIEKISKYMTGGVSTGDIELTEISIEEEGMKAKVISWSAIAEALVKKLTQKS